MANGALPIGAEWDDDRSLDRDENDYAHNLALAVHQRYVTGRNVTGAEFQQIHELLINRVRADIPGITEDRLNAVVNSVWKRVNDISQRQREGAIAEEQANLSNALIRRKTPPPAINAPVVGAAMEGHVLDATRAFGHKVGRAVRLSSLSGYELPTKSQTGNPQLTGNLVSRHLNDLADVQANIPRRSQLDLELRQIRAHIDVLLGQVQSAKELNKRLSAENSAQLKNILAGVLECAGSLTNYTEAVAARQLQQDLQNQSGWQRFWGKAGVGFRVLFYDNADSQIYADFYAQQTAVEEQMVALETRLKDILQALFAEPVEPNLNARTAYDAQTITLDIFRARQERLNNRLTVIRRLLERIAAGNAGNIANFNKAVEQVRTVEKDRAKKIEGIDRHRAAVEKRTPAIVEQIFWHEFGDAVTMIRDWQSNLPQVAAQGREVYTAQITAINGQYRALRQQVADFQRQHGVDGLLDLLSEEIGVIETMQQSDPAYRMARGRMSAIGRELNQMRVPRRQPVFPPAAAATPPATPPVAPHVTPPSAPVSRPMMASPSSSAAALRMTAPGTAALPAAPVATPAAAPSAAPAKSPIITPPPVRSATPARPPIITPPPAPPAPPAAPPSAAAAVPAAEPLASEAVKTPKPPEPKVEMSNISETENLDQLAANIRSMETIAEEALAQFREAKKLAKDHTSELAAQKQFEQTERALEEMKYQYVSAYALQYGQQDPEKYLQAVDIKDARKAYYQAMETLAPLAEQMAQLNDAIPKAIEQEKDADWEEQHELKPLQANAEGQALTFFSNKYDPAYKTVKAAKKNLNEAYSRFGQPWAAVAFVRVNSIPPRPTETANVQIAVPAAPVAPAETNVATVKAEPLNSAAELKLGPLTAEEIEGLSEEKRLNRLEIILEKTLGLNQMEARKIITYLKENVETSKPGKYAEYVSLFLLYSDILEILFTTKYLPKKTGKKSKPLDLKFKNPSDIGNSKILAVLSPRLLSTLREKINKSSIQEVVKEVLASGSMEKWLKTVNLSN